jgi:hypothetical protein
LKQEVDNGANSHYDNHINIKEISMQNDPSRQDLHILVEFNGTRKSILRAKLPEARQMEAHMQELARKAGYPEQEIKEQFTLRIVEE